LPARRMAGIIARGLLYGFLLWLLFIVILPPLLQVIMPGEEAIVTKGYIYYILVAVALGMASKAFEGTPHSYTIAFLEKLYGILVFYKIVNGGILQGTITLQGERIVYTVDTSALVYIIIFITLISALLDVRRMTGEQG